MRPPRLVLNQPPVKERPLRPADALLPAAVALWAVGVSKVDASAIGPFGLLTALPLVYYAGLALLVLSAAIELRRPRLSGWRMSLHSVALVVMLYGTAPLVYREGRYSWLYKTVGVVQYVNAHGSLNSHIDIYNNWPGFFAFAAWFDRVAGVTTPLAYAKWAQLIFELAAVPLLYLIYDGLRLSTRQRWVAMLLFSSSNWIGQDYFSPQALGTVLSLGIMAIAMRWLYVHRPARATRDIMATARRWLHLRRPPTVALRWSAVSRDSVESTAESPASVESTAESPASVEGAAESAASPDSAAESAASPDSAAVPTSAASMRTTWAVCVLVCVLFAVLTFTHELSPYMLVAQLGALAFLRMLRPAWLPVVLLAIAVGYFAPRFGFVNSHFGLLKSIGAFFTNITPPSFNQGVVTHDQQVVQRSALLLSLAIWGLAALGVWLHRRAGHAVLGLALLAFSPFVLLGLADYGHEGVLRVYLFSLPWSAALASFVLTPESDPTRQADAGTRQRGEGRARRPIVPAVAGSLLAPAALLASLTLFIPAFFGDDAINVMSRQTVTTIASFMRTARPGPVMVAFDRAPVSDTAKYYRFPLVTLFGPNGVLGAKPDRITLATVAAYEALKRTNGTEPAYLAVTPTMITYNDAYQLVKPGYLASLLNQLRSSAYWQLIIANPGVLIYQLKPAYSINPSVAQTATTLGQR